MRSFVSFVRLYFLNTNEKKPRHFRRVRRIFIVAFLYRVGRVLCVVEVHRNKKWVNPDSRYPLASINGSSRNIESTARWTAVLCHEL